MMIVLKNDFHLQISTLITYEYQQQRYRNLAKRGKIYVRYDNSSSLMNWAAM